MKGEDCSLKSEHGWVKARRRVASSGGRVGRRKRGTGRSGLCEWILGNVEEAGLGGKGARGFVGSSVGWMNLTRGTALAFTRRGACSAPWERSFIGIDRS